MAVYKLGSNGKAVTEIQKRLNELLPLAARLRVSGSFDEMTRQAVRDFQKRNGLKNDGVVGSKTSGKLGIGPWRFLYVHRLEHLKLKGVTLGRMYVSLGENSWAFLCHSYELPLITDNKGKTKNRVSCVTGEKTYPLRVRTDGFRKWRMQLLNTGHRKYVQIHRASEYITSAGCILPINLSTFNRLKKDASDEDGLTVKERRGYARGKYESGDGYEGQQNEGKRRGKIINSLSMAYMHRIKHYYESLGTDHLGRASVHFSKYAPTKLFVGPLSV